MAARWPSAAFRLVSQETVGAPLGGGMTALTWRHGPARPPMGMMGGACAVALGLGVGAAGGAADGVKAVTIER